MFTYLLLLFVLKNIPTTISSKELNLFLQNLKESESDLQWIREMSGHEPSIWENDNLKSKRSIDELLSSFSRDTSESDDKQPSFLEDNDIGDKWYNDFRSDECKGGKCAQKTAKIIGKSKKKKKEQKKARNKSAKPKQKLQKFIKSSAKDAYKNEESQNEVCDDCDVEPDYDDYDNSKDGKSVAKNEEYDFNQDISDLIDNKSDKRTYQPIYGSSSLQTSGINSPSDELQDQNDQRQNDLSHEADYKLSKIEQESMEKNHKSPLFTKNYGYKFPILSSKRTLQNAPTSDLTYQDYHHSSKRSPKALDEIKLKTSERMMSRGFGPSLPSDSLLDNHRYNSFNDMKVPKSQSGRNPENDDPEEPMWSVNVHEEEQHKLNKKREISESPSSSERIGRKLLSINDYDFVDDYDEKDNSNMNSKEEGYMKEFDDHKKESEVNSKMNHFNKESKAVDESCNNQGKQLFGFPLKRDKSSALNFIDEFSQENAAALDDGSTMFVDPKNEANNSSSAKIHYYPVIPETRSLSKLSAPSSTSTSKPEKIVPLNESEAPISFKLNIAFNASHANTSQAHHDHRLAFPRTRVNAIFSRNPGKPAQQNNKAIKKRGIIFPRLYSSVTKRANAEMKKNIAKLTEESSIDDLLSGKLSANLVNAIFRLVETNENFQSYILPSLKTKKMKISMGCNNLNSIKDDKNSEQISRSEQMLRQVMETISAIIEHQVRSRTCIPLCRNLKEFYDLIIATRSENDHLLKARSRKVRAAANYAVVSEFDLRPHVRQKYSIVKKLLNDYDYLPSEDQEKTRDVKNMLEQHLEYLKELDKFDQRRRKREIVARNSRIRGSKMFNRDSSEISSEFRKLIKAAEIIKKNALLDEYDDYDI